MEFGIYMRITTTAVILAFGLFLVWVGTEQRTLARILHTICFAFGIWIIIGVWCVR